jgi:hypothetical protein
MTAKTDIFSGKRRELLAKTLMDIAKVTIAAAFASELFTKFSNLLRVLFAAGVLLVITVAFLVCPKTEE